MRLKNSGFTLIELIVVTTILVILAAIALPSMHTFNIRAKVARMQADLKTVSTMLEMYAIDNEDYPLMRGQVQGPDGNWIPAEPGPDDLYYPTGGEPQPAIGGFRTIPRTLTTPIGYMSSAPDDLFKSGIHFLNPGDGVLIPINFETGDPRTKDLIYLNFEQFVELGSPAYDESDLIEFGEWMIFSVGPDTELTDLRGRTPYDPTNGVMSPGEIRVFQNKRKAGN